MTFIGYAYTMKMTFLSPTSSDLRDLPMDISCSKTYLIRAILHSATEEGNVARDQASRASTYHLTDMPRSALRGEQLVDEYRHFVICV